MSKTECEFKITLELKEPIVRVKTITHIHVPCGKCARCLQRKKMEWSFRMMDELVQSKTAYFITITYNPESVPYNKYGKKTLIETRDQDLNIWLLQKGRKRITKKFKQECYDRSIQGFFKRLRQNHNRTKDTYESVKNNLSTNDKIKFFAAGEYGEERGRPHYHAIIFNTSEKAIMKSWTLGDVQVKKAAEANINYVMKYLDKKHGQEKVKMKTPEFHTMSEGIGISYINKHKEWHKQNLDVLYVATPKGIRIPMPKYYREKIFTEKERQEQVIIVTDILEEIRQDEISKKGMNKYAKEKNTLRNESERRFKKKMKKRNVD